ncbi:MAG: 4-hydroxy-tetrahydrodipicolinate synthase [Elusimicrobiales bacterium]|nr:4-hydroxy-tetrahydrodipicolinate synthase [Elusimicrobiales bacterium]
MFKLSGCFTALITPFKNGKIDFASFRKLIHFQAENGVSGIVPCGSTGEASSLGREEYLEVIKTAIDEAAGRTQILAGAGGNNTAATAELVREVAALKPDAILSVAPCYNKPTQEGLKAHFKAVSAAADTVPVVLYNIPGRTGVNMQPQTIISIAKECRNVIGVKEASGSLDQVSEIVRLANAAAGEIPQGFAVISGDDSLTVPMMSVGASGVISVVSNIYPCETAEMCRAAANGDFKSAAAFHYKLFPAIKALFSETNPIPVKYAAYLKGIVSSPEMRLPLTEYSLEKREQLKKNLF